MLHVLSAFAPLTFLIVYALKTRKMADAIFTVGGCWVVMTISSAFCCWACCKRVQNKYPPVNGGIFAYIKSRAASTALLFIRKRETDSTASDPAGGRSRPPACR